MYKFEILCVAKKSLGYMCNEHSLRFLVAFAFKIYRKLQIQKLGWTFFVDP